ACRGDPTSALLHRADSLPIMLYLHSERRLTMKRGSTLMIIVAAMMLLGLRPAPLAASVSHEPPREQFTTWPFLPQLDSSCPEIPSGVVITAVTNERVRQTFRKKWWAGD